MGFRIIDIAHLINRLSWFLPSFKRKNGESLGQKGERVALKYLQKQGLSFLAKNVSNRFGEIDLILKDKQVIVFVEVRSRSSASHGQPVETVSFVKQRKLSRAATAFLKSNKLSERSARFDVVTILWQNSDHEQEIKHFINAFEQID